MNVNEIYDQLLFGNTLTLHFPTLRDAESCRVTLAAIKRRTEQQLISLGVMTIEEVKALSFRLLNKDTPPYEAVLLFKMHRVKKSYTIITSEIAGTEEAVEGSS